MEKIGAAIAVFFMSAGFANAGAFIEKSSGMIVGYHFDEGLGTVARDVSPQSNNCTITGATWVSGPNGNGKALHFDGGDSCDSGTDDEIVMTTFTIISFFKPDFTIGQGGGEKAMSLVAQWTSGYSSFFGLRIKQDVLTFNMGSGDSPQDCQGSLKVSTGTWHMGAGRRLAGVRRDLWLNGVPDPVTCATNVSPVANNGAINIGKDQNTANQDYYGDMDGAIIFEKYLSDAELNYIYSQWRGNPRMIVEGH